MCNALSPEKAVIWSVLHGLSTKPIKRDYFRHPTYRAWFDAVEHLRASRQALDVGNIERELDTASVPQNDAARRSLKRLLRVSLPSRIRDNAHLFTQSLADIHHGRTVHIERLIN